MAAGKKLTKKSGESLSPASHEIVPSLVPPALLGDLRSLIDATRVRVAVGINTEMVLLYWDIGERIRKEILKDERAAYGKQVVNTVSDQLTMQYGRGFTRANLFHMLHFFETFPDRKIVYSLSGQLSWTHFRNIIYIKDSLAREFYTEMCRLERWSVRTLQIFERGFGKNTGLGLYLSREILAITSITIRETGEPGKGARFEMTVPKGMWRIAGEDT